MHFTKSSVLAGLLPAVMAKNFQVIVGQNNQLTFTPNTVNAAAGDTVQFMFANSVRTSNATLTSANHRLTSVFRTTLPPPAIQIMVASPAVNLTPGSSQPPASLLLPQRRKKQRPNAVGRTVFGSARMENCLPSRFRFRIRILSLCTVRRHSIANRVWL